METCLTWGRDAKVERSQAAEVQAQTLNQHRGPANTQTEAQAQTDQCTLIQKYIYKKYFFTENSILIK